MIYPPSFAYMIINQYVSYASEASPGPAHELWQFGRWVAWHCFSETWFLKKYNGKGWMIMIGQQPQVTRFGKQRFLELFGPRPEHCTFCCNAQKLWKETQIRTAKSTDYVQRFIFGQGGWSKEHGSCFAFCAPMTSITNSCETQFSKQRGHQSLVQPAVSFNEPPIKRRLKVFNTWINEYWWYLVWLQIQVSSDPFVMEERRKTWKHVTSNSALHHGSSPVVTVWPDIQRVVRKLKLLKSGQDCGVKWRLVDHMTGCLSRNEIMEEYVIIMFFFPSRNSACDETRGVLWAIFCTSKLFSTWKLKFLEVMPVAVWH